MSDLGYGPPGVTRTPDGAAADPGVPPHDGVREPQQAAAAAADDAAEAIGAGPGTVDAMPEAVGPVPLGVVLRETGNAEVDAAVARLADADELPTDGHVEVYEDVHRDLRDALTALDENRS